MLKSNSEFCNEATDSLSRQWGMAVIATLVYSLLSGLTNQIPIVGWGISILLLPIEYGMAILFLNNFRGESINVGTLFDGFKDYGRILGTLLLTLVYTLLWSLLLIVPGIIKTFSYSMTCYILKDQPELSFNAAIERSMAMMHGHKMQLFMLYLGFIGWFILSLLTLGIGFLWLIPYVNAAQTAFYLDLKREEMETTTTV